MSNSHHSMHKEPRVTVEDRSHNGHNGTKDVNIVVVGKKGVGKTAIVVRYLTRRFIGDYDSQMEAMYEHADTVDGKPVNMHILDTAWRIDEKQIEVHEDAVRWADGVMLVYSITDSNSFDRLSEIADHALACRGDSKLVMALVASKCDLLHQKRVSDTRAAQFCAEYNCLFYETSASDSYGEIENAFTSVCRQVKLIHKKREKLSKLMQSPAVSAKLQIRNSLQNFVEKKWRRRTSTM